MDKKTFYFHEEYYFDFYNLKNLKVGDEVILIKHDYEDGGVNYHIIPHAGEGIPGNMNESIKRYHGWRGTTNGVSIHALGVRKIKSISIFKDKPNDLWDTIKIVLSNDLHPDWE